MKVVANIIQAEAASRLGLIRYAAPAPRSETVLIGE